MSAARPLATAAPGDERPLVAHIIHRLDVGGMENGLVNLINHMPAERYRHAIVCMTRYTDFSQRIHRDDVSLHALHKREGKDLGVHRRLHRLLRSLRPAIVHTRNLATLEAQATAAAAGVRARIHGEHGWDIGDLDGARTKHRLMRRLADRWWGAISPCRASSWTTWPVPSACRRGGCTTSATVWTPTASGPAVGTRPRHCRTASRRRAA